MSNHIDDLREHLFGTIAALRDQKAPMPVERARAIAEVAQTIINSAKVEVDFARVTNNGTSSFLEPRKEEEKLPPGITRITRHRLEG